MWVSDVSDLRAGDELFIGPAASVQFQAAQALVFRLIKVDVSPTYHGWCWLDGYVLHDGIAIARRTVFVQVRGLARHDSSAKSALPSWAARNGRSAFAQHSGPANEGTRF